MMYNYKFILIIERLYIQLYCTYLYEMCFNYTYEMRFNYLYVTCAIYRLHNPD